MINCVDKDIQIYLGDCIYDSCVTSKGKTYIYIVDTRILCRVMDEARYVEGKTPLFNKINGCDLNLDDWYEFRIIIDHARGCADTIEAWVEGHSEHDEYYQIKIKDSLDQVVKQLSEFGLTLETVQEI